MKQLLRPLLTLGGILIVWEAAVRIFDLPHYMLPAPSRVALAFGRHWESLLANASVTLGEIILGLLLGALLGAAAAIALILSAGARRWFLPLLVASQAIPVFALAPLLVLWFGYGVASKVAMAVLIILFPVAATLYDGLRRTDPGWLDLAHVMTANEPRHRLRLLVQVRLPASLPALASGLRVAAATAPIGAVIGEWVGASSGLGFLMLQANARVQTDLMFAALFVLSLCAVALYFGIDWLGRWMLPWQAESRMTLSTNTPE